MKRFLIKTLLFVFFVIAITIGSIYLIYYKIDNGNYYKIDSQKSNLILGHSHTECAFNDSLIQQTINLSNGGENHFYTHFKLKKILEHNRSIKNVFLSFSNNQIDLSSDSIGVWSNRNMDRWFSKYGAFMQYQDIKILAKNNFPNFLNVQSVTARDYILFLFKNDNNIIKSHNWGGYNKLNNKLKIEGRVKSSLKSSEFQYSEVNINYFKKSIELCKKNDVKVYLVRCPTTKKWKGLSNEIFFQRIVKNDFKDVNFLDFNNFPLDDSCFADMDHLNHNGATRFSIFFDELIKNGLLESKNKQEMINIEMKKFK